MRRPTQVSLAVLITVAALAAFNSCGGGSSSSGVTPPAESLTGTYTLDYFYAATFNCGSALGAMPYEAVMACQSWGRSTCTEYTCDWTAPENEIYSESGYTVSGTLVVLDSRIHEALSYSGNSGASADTYTVIYTGGTTAEGVLDYLNGSDPTFICDGDVLTLALEADVLGMKVFKHAEWVKVSDEAVAPE